MAVSVAAHWRSGKPTLRARACHCEKNKACLKNRSASSSEEAQGPGSRSHRLQQAKLIRASATRLRSLEPWDVGIPGAQSVTYSDADWHKRPVRLKFSRLVLGTGMLGIKVDCMQLS